MPLCQRNLTSVFLQVLLSSLTPRHYLYTKIYTQNQRYVLMLWWFSFGSDEKSDDCWTTSNKASEHSLT